MRIDKFLKVSRIIKRRTVANEAGADVKVGDIIEIQFGNNVTKVEVLNLQESTKKEDAVGMYRAVE